jgi:hypothetical protein
MIQIHLIARFTDHIYPATTHKQKLDLSDDMKTYIYTVKSHKTHNTLKIMPQFEYITPKIRWHHTKHDTPRDMILLHIHRSHSFLVPFKNRKPSSQMVWNTYYNETAKTCSAGGRVGWEGSSFMISETDLREYAIFFRSSLAFDLARRQKPPPLVLSFISYRPPSFAAFPSKSKVGTRTERAESIS